jgi:hypothetical protein
VPMHWKKETKRQLNVRHSIPDRDCYCVVGNTDISTRLPRNFRIAGNPTGTTDRLTAGSFVLLHSAKSRFAFRRFSAHCTVVLTVAVLLARLGSNVSAIVAAF